jgi:hypothetical protein
VFLFFSACVLITGHFIYQSQKNKIIEAKQNELSAIADLKVGQIAQWRAERINDAEYFHNNPLIVRQVEAFIQNPRESQLHSDIMTWLKTIQTSMGYSSARLFDSKGDVRLMFSDGVDTIGCPAKQVISEALSRNTVVLSDIHRSAADTHIHLDLAIPLSLQGQHEKNKICVLLLQINPDKNLFPLIQSWPTLSRTSETLLLRREGDSVLYLNELRHRKNTALRLHLSISNERLPAAMAARGIEGIVEGLDYRGVPVFA